MQYIETSFQRPQLKAPDKALRDSQATTSMKILEAGKLFQWGKVE